MPVFEHARILPCPPDEAWAPLVDFPSRPAHSERYRQADLPDGSELAPGHRIQLQIARDRFTSVVTQVARPHRLAHRTTGPGFWVEYRYNLRVCDDADPGFVRRFQPGASDHYYGVRRLVWNHHCHAKARRLPTLRR